MRRSCLTRQVRALPTIAYVQPHERLRELLAAERRQGVPFPEAWQRAVADAGRTWGEAFEWSRDAWERAYESRPRLTVDWLAPHDLGDGTRHDVVLLG